MADGESDLIGAGASVSGLGGATDIRGVKRHGSAPTIGAYEYLYETVTYDGAGRVATRSLVDRTLAYSYNARGQLTGYSDSANSANNASYSYDIYHRRTSMTVGNTTTRMLYDGDDVIEDHVDVDGNGTIDRRRVYLLLGGIDRRAGFIDLVPGEDPAIYYYLTDQVGSVLQVIDEDGSIVNQYDYDAFGNILWENSFEGVDNRYTFQGREYDYHAGHYYYRFRTYFPEWGMFSGLDMEIRLDYKGPGTYVAMNNNPQIWVDPKGLYDETKVLNNLANYNPVLYAYLQTSGQRLVADNSVSKMESRPGEIRLNPGLTDREARNVVAGILRAQFIQRLENTKSRIDQEVSSLKEKRDALQKVLESEYAGVYQAATRLDEKYESGQRTRCGIAIRQDLKQAGAELKGLPKLQARIQAYNALIEEAETYAGPVKKGLDAIMLVSKVKGAAETGKAIAENRDITKENLLAPWTNFKKTLSFANEILDNSPLPGPVKKLGQLPLEGALQVDNELEFLAEQQVEMNKAIETYWPESIVSQIYGQPIPDWVR